MLIQFPDLVSSQLGIAALVTDRQQQIGSTSLVRLSIRTNGILIQQQGLGRVGDRPACSQQDNGLNPVGQPSVSATAMQGP